MIAITFALPAESADFVRLLAEPRSVVDDVIYGKLHGHMVAVVHTGVGEKTCRPTIEKFLQRERVDYLVSAGFAGALDPELRVADLVIAENYSAAALLKSTSLHLGETGVYLTNIVTVSSVVSSPEARAELARSSGAAAVDMETGLIAAACAAHVVPMIALRAISDTIAEPFPAPPHVLFDLERQRTNFTWLALYLVTHPSSIGRLRAFARRIATAREALTSALATIVRSDPAGDPPASNG